MKQIEAGDLTLEEVGLTQEQYEEQKNELEEGQEEECDDPRDCKQSNERERDQDEE